MADDNTDMQSCCICPNEHPIEHMVMMGDDWICPECFAAWEAEFHACEHEWEPSFDTMGDPGRVCRKCSGFIVDEMEA